MYSQPKLNSIQDKIYNAASDLLAKDPTDIALSTLLTRFKKDDGSHPELTLALANRVQKLTGSPEFRNELSGVSSSQIGDGFRSALAEVGITGPLSRLGNSVAFTRALRQLKLEQDTATNNSGSYLSINSGSDLSYGNLGMPNISHRRNSDQINNQGQNFRNSYKNAQTALTLNQQLGLPTWMASNPDEFGFNQTLPALLLKATTNKSLFDNLPATNSDGTPALNADGSPKKYSFDELSKIKPGDFTTDQFNAIRTAFEGKTGISAYGTVQANGQTEPNSMLISFFEQEASKRKDPNSQSILTAAVSYFKAATTNAANAYNSKASTGATTVASNSNVSDVGSF